MCQSVLTDNARVEQKPSSGSLGGNVAKLVSSKVAAQVIAFAAAPVIARLYSPDSFGVLQIFTSIAGVITIVSCLRYELSIPLGKDEKEASASLSLSLIIAFLFAMIVLVAVAPLRDRIAHSFKSPELKVFLLLLPIVIFTGGLNNSLRYWIAREGRFGLMAWSGFISVLVGSLVTIAWALIIGGSAAGLFAGNLTILILGALLLLLFSSRKLISDIKNMHVNFATLLKVAKHHRRFPLFLTWSGLLNGISSQFPAFILGLCFSTTIVGYYSLGNRLVSLPMGLLGASISEVFFPAAAREYDKTGTLSKIVSSMFKRLVQIGVFPMIALGFLGAFLFEFAFGKSWVEAGVYTQILSVYVLLQFLSSPLSMVFAILHRQDIVLAWDVVSISSRSLALLIGSKIAKPRIALLLYSVANVFVYSYYMVWIVRNSDVSLKWAFRLLLKYLCLSCLLLLSVASIAWYLASSLAALLGSCLAFIVYIWLLYKLDASLRTEVSRIISRLSFER